MLIGYTIFDFIESDKVLTDLIKDHPPDITFVECEDVLVTKKFQYVDGKFISYVNLAEVKAEKLASLSGSASDEYIGGFFSSCTGSPLWYDSDSDTQTVINRQYLIALGSPTIYASMVFFAGLPTGVTPVRAKATKVALETTKTVQMLNASQMVSLGNDLASAWSATKGKLWTLQSQVNVAISVDAVNAINW